MNKNLNWQRADWRGAACVLAAVLATGCHTTPPEPTEHSPTFRVLTFNIHHGEGLDGHVDLPRIAEVIQRERADLVALQEVDKGVLRTARRDLSGELAALTGLTCVFSNNYHYQGGEYGNAVLSRFPVLNATNSHYQMLRTNEQRGLLQLTLEVHGRQLIFMNTHLDHRQDDAERLQNVREIQALAKQHTRTPVILCGDFNTTPGSPVHQRLKETFDDAWEMANQTPGWTYPAGNPSKRIDYVWVSRTARVSPVTAHVPASAASDHRPLVVELHYREPHP